MLFTAALKIGTRVRPEDGASGIKQEAGYGG